MVEFSPVAGLPRGGMPRPPAVPPRLEEARIGAVRRSVAAGARHGAQRDNLWEVLHRREQSHSPQPSRGGSPRPRRELSAPGRPEDVHDLARRLPVQVLPPLAWEPPAGGGVAVGLTPSNDATPSRLAPPEALPQWDHHDLKARAFLKPRLLELEPSTVDALGWLEKRLDAAQAEQISEFSHRFNTFEQNDRRFKEWVQQEQENVRCQLQQVQQAEQQQQQQQQQQSSAALAAHSRQFDARLHEVEAAVSQVSAQSQALGYALQAQQQQASAVEDATGAPVPVALDALRKDLDREAAARTSLGGEIANSLTEMQNAMDKQQRLAEQAVQQLRQALDPSIHSLRAEFDGLREQLRRSEASNSRRCEEVEASFAQRLAHVQEAALTAAREIKDEQHGIVGECRTSLASLQTILDAKDRITAQLHSIQHQRREDDRHELKSQVQQGLEMLQKRVSELEAGLTSERGARTEAVQQVDVHCGRLGAALEQGQAAWLKDSERLAEEIRSLRSKPGSEGESAAVGSWERRLAEAVDFMQRRLDVLESDTSLSKVAVEQIEERLAELRRLLETVEGNVEDQFRRRLLELQAVQASAEKEIAQRLEQHDGACGELQRQASALEDRLLAATTGVEARATSRLTEELRLERNRLLDELQRLVEEERASRLRGESESLEAGQRRLATMEELTMRRLDDLRTRQDEALTLQRRSIEAQALIDRADFKRQLQEEAASGPFQQKLSELQTCMETECKARHAFEKATRDLEDRLRDASCEANNHRLALEQKLQDFVAACCNKELLESMEELGNQIDELRSETNDALAAEETRAREAEEACDAEVSRLQSKNNETERLLNALEANLLPQVQELHQLLAESKDANMSELASALTEFGELEQRLEAHINEVKRLVDIHSQTLEDDLLPRLNDCQTQQATQEEAMRTTSEELLRQLEKHRSSNSGDLASLRSAHEEQLGKLKQNIDEQAEELRRLLDSRTQALQADLAPQLDDCQRQQAKLEDTRRSAIEDLRQLLTEHRTKLAEARAEISAQLDELRQRMQSQEERQGSVDVAMELQDAQLRATEELHNLVAEHRKASDSELVTARAELGAQLDELRKQLQSQEELQGSTDVLLTQLRGQLDGQGQSVEELQECVDKMQADVDQAVARANEVGSAGEELAQRIADVSYQQERAQTLFEDKLEEHQEQQQQDLHECKEELSKQFNISFHKQEQALHDVECRARAAEADMNKRFGEQEFAKQVQDLRRQVERSHEELRSQVQSIEDLQGVDQSYKWETELEEINKRLNNVELCLLVEQNSGAKQI